jgi:hypothetical protein
MIWGWSHAPYLGGVIEGNILEDSEQGSHLGVEHSQHIKTNKGRTYMSVRVNQNVVRWSEAFLSRKERATAKEPLVGLTLGYAPSHDPGEFVVFADGNRLEAPQGHRPAPPLRIHAALYNSQRVVNRKLSLPAGGPPAAPGRRAADARVAPSIR